MDVLPVPRLIVAKNASVGIGYCADLAHVLQDCLTHSSLINSEGVLIALVFMWTLQTTWEVGIEDYFVCYAR